MRQYKDKLSLLAQLKFIRSQRRAAIENRIAARAKLSWLAGASTRWTFEHSKLMRITRIGFKSTHSRTINWTAERRRVRRQWRRVSNCKLLLKQWPTMSTADPASRLQWIFLPNRKSNRGMANCHHCQWEAFIIQRNWIPLRIAIYRMNEH